MNQALKYFLGIILVVGLRLLPHPPNVEPITATLMPFAKQWGAFAAMAFAAAAILFFDVVTGTFGPWSLFTLGAYVLLAASAGLFFRYTALTGRVSYIAFAIIGTLVYDALTGLTVGPLFFGQTFVSALVGQIPFTLYHLAGNVLLAAVLSPLIERFILENEQLEVRAVTHRLGFSKN